MSTQTDVMTVSTAVAHEVGREQTAQQLASQIQDALAGRRLDLALLLVSPHYLDELDRLTLRLHELLSARVLLGASGEAVICGETELENQAAAVLWAAHLPDVQLSSFHLSQDDLQRIESDEELCEHLAVKPQQDPAFLLLGDPFSIDILDALERLQRAYPGRPAIGGMASAAPAPGRNRVIFDGQVLRQGLTGVAVWGGVRIDTLVSQGCRPIGRPLVVTRATGKLVEQLGGKEALQAFRAMLYECPRHDVELARSRGLFVGRVINEYKPTFSRGDFLIRTCLGFDEKTGVMAVDEPVRVGQTIQFHVRDAESASEDLSALLAAADPRPLGGLLLFSCNGRGTRLFAQPHHDARMISAHFGGAPLAGFFCAGEIGPVGGRNFLHGHTASVGVVRPIIPSSDA